MSRGVVRAVLALLAAAIPVQAAQDCNTRDGEFALLLSASRVERPARIDAWELGTHAETSLTPGLLTRASYRYQHTGGAPLHVIGFGAAAPVRLPAMPCITVDLLGTVAGSLHDGDYYRNITIPGGLVFAKRLELGGTGFTPFGGGMVVFSATDARLLGFSLRSHALDYALVAGARIRSGRFISELKVVSVGLGAGLGPQPLGRLRAELSVGARFPKH